jgi:hypothetical protein
VLAVHGAGPSSGRVLLLGVLHAVELAGAVVPSDTVSHQVELSRSDPGAAVLTGESTVD